MPDIRESLGSAWGTIRNIAADWCLMRAVELSTGEYGRDVAATVYGLLQRDIERQKRDLSRN